jgi:hypothetical protein
MRTKVDSFCPPKKYGVVEYGNQSSYTPKSMGSKII